MRVSGRSHAVSQSTVLACLLWCGALQLCVRSAESSSRTQADVSQQFEDELVSSYTAPLTSVATERAARHGIDLQHRLPNGRTVHEQLRGAAAAVLPECVDSLHLRPQFVESLNSSLPAHLPPAPCGRTLRLLFLRQRPEPTPVTEKLQDMGSMLYREYALGGALLRLGHNVTFATLAHLDQLGDLTQYDAIYTCKLFTYEFTRDVLKASGVPLVYDYVDNKVWWTWLSNTSALPYPDIKDRMYLFDLIITGNRFMKAAHELLFPGTSAATVYHQHANYAGFGRKDRSAPVRVVAIHDTNIGKFDAERLLHVKVQEYAEAHGLEVRISGYTGHGWDPQEFATYLTTQDVGDQLGWYMGYSSVDVAVVWPWLDGPAHSCAKPSLRLFFWMSLGVPVIVFPELSYSDWLVQWGYPLVAANEEDVVMWLDRLAADPQLRQNVSQMGLEMAAEASTEAIARQWADTVCEFLDTKQQQHQGGGRSMHASKPSDGARVQRLQRRQ